MKYFFVSMMMLFIVAIAYPQGDAMFRDNPTHNFFIAVDSNKAFTKPAWHFKTNAAIRSTAVSNKSLVFVGSADGYLYALQKQTGKLAWKFNCAAAINASPAYSNNIVYVASLDQQLYAISAPLGKLLWRKQLGQNPRYNWGFDYYSSSPVIKEDTLFTAAADGTIVALNKKNGNTFWRMQINSFVRSTPAVADRMLYVGDTKGVLHALYSKSGNEAWTYTTKGYELNNTSFGFDRNAIISSPAIYDSLVLFGGRDGFLYAINRYSGREVWNYDYKVSWIISSPVVIGNKVFTGTSDGQFIQALDVHTGKEIWRTQTFAPVWASAVAAGKYIYVAGNDGVLYCLDMQTGKSLPHPFMVNNRIFVSPAISDSSLFLGTDDGLFYCFQLQQQAKDPFKHLVYWDKPLKYDNSRSSPDILLKSFLRRKGYELLNGQQLMQLSKQRTSAKNLVVLATNFLASDFWKTDSTGTGFPLKNFMNEGNVVVAVGFNPLAINFDDTDGFYASFDFKRAAAILGVSYSENDLRSLAGFYPSMATTNAIAMGMKSSYIGSCPLTSNNVDIILGKDERNRVNSFVKKVGNKGGAFVQLWIDNQYPEDYNFIDLVISNIEKLI